MVQIGGIKLEAPVNIPVKLPFDTSKLPFDTSKIPDISIETIKNIDPKKLFVKNIVRYGWTQENCLRVRKLYGK